MRTPLDRYIAELARPLAVDAPAKAATLEEVRAHLEEKTASYVAEGMERDAAEERAASAFGARVRCARGHRAQSERHASHALAAGARNRWPGAAGIHAGANTLAGMRIPLRPLVRQYPACDHPGSPRPADGAAGGAIAADGL